MNEIKATKKIIRHIPEQEVYAEERGKEDRRKSHSEGFFYISMIGFVDRREKCRRCDELCEF